MVAAEETTVALDYIGMHRILDEAADAGLIPGDAVTGAHVVWAAMHGLLTLHLAGQLTIGRTLDELIRSLPAGSSTLPLALGRLISSKPLSTKRLRAFAVPAAWAISTRPSLRMRASSPICKWLSTITLSGWRGVTTSRTFNCGLSSSTVPMPPGWAPSSLLSTLLSVVAVMEALALVASPPGEDLKSQI